jgi:hypothetical protein
MEIPSKSPSNTDEKHQFLVNHHQNPEHHHGWLVVFRPTPLKNHGLNVKLGNIMEN